MDLSAAPASYALIAINVALSLYAFYGDRNFINQSAFQVQAVREKKQYYRIVTSSFVHLNFLHLLVNMMTLYFFGPTIEKILGTEGFLVVYFGSILASGFISLIVNRHRPDYSSVGASDAVSGVVLSFCCFYPFQSIYLMLIPIPIPAIIYGAFFIYISMTLMQRDQRIIAHEGHLGGALAGVALTILMKPEVITRFFS